MRLSIGMIVVLLAALLAYPPLVNVLAQQKANTRFVETPATVMYSEIQVIHHIGNRASRSYDAYAPYVVYFYRVNGAPYTARAVMFNYAEGTLEWAQGIIEPYKQVAFRGTVNDPQVSNAVAYVNLDNPWQAILVRRYALGDYLWLYVTLLAGGAGACLAAGGIGLAVDAMEAVAVDQAGWKSLLPESSARDRCRHAVVWLAVAAIVHVPLLVDMNYYMGPRDGLVVAGTALVGVLLLGLGVLAWRRLSVCRHMDDPSLLLRPAPMELSKPLEIHLQAEAHTRLMLRAATATFICTEQYTVTSREGRGTKERSETRTHGEKKVILATAAEIPADGWIDGKATVTFDAKEWRATGHAQPTVETTYSWSIRVVIELEGMVDYVGIFPLHVTAPIEGAPMTEISLAGELVDRGLA